MLRRAILLLLALTTTAGSAVPAVTVYRCAMSGRRNLTGCCCAAPDAAPAPAASTCASGRCGGSVAENPAENRVEDAPAVLAGACCTASEQTVLHPSVGPRDAEGLGWKKALADVRVALAASPFDPAVELEARAVHVFRVGSPPLEPSEQPLFLRLCRLLI